MCAVPLCCSCAVNSGRSLLESNFENNVVTGHIATDIAVAVAAAVAAVAEASNNFGIDEPS